MNAQERNEWLQTFKQAMIETKGFTSEQELQDEMERLGYLRNRFLHSLFTVGKEKKEGRKERLKYIEIDSSIICLLSKRRLNK